MAQTFALELQGVADGTVPSTKKDGRISLAALRRSRATIALAGQAAGDTVVLGSIPEGASFAFAVVTASVAVAATVAIGTAASPAKYKAAGAVANADTPTLAGTAAAIAAKPFDTAPEQLIATIGGQALPANGTLVIDLFYSMR